MLKNSIPDDERVNKNDEIMVIHYLRTHTQDYTREHQQIEQERRQLEGIERQRNEEFRTETEIMAEELIAQEEQVTDQQLFEILKRENEVLSQQTLENEHMQRVLR